MDLNGGLAARQSADFSLMAFFEISRDAYLVFDQHFKVEYINPRARDLFFLPGEGTIGRTLVELCPPGPQALKKCREVVSDGVPGSWVAFCKGAGRWLEVSAAPLGGGRFAAAMRDVTDQKRANDRQNTLISTLSHEFRNPLAAVSMGLALMERVEPGGEQDLRAREIIKSQVAQLVQLVDNLLDAAGIVREELRLERQVTKLNDIIRDVLREFETRFRAKGIALEAAYGAGESVYVDADPARMRQVFGHLLSNALKFTQTGGTVRLEVATDEAAQRVEISIADTGVGIAPEHLPGLFDTFTRADDSPGREVGGLGLGLSVVKGIVDRHGGSTEVTSELGKGSEFIIKLPVLQVGLPRRAY